MEQCSVLVEDGYISDVFSQKRFEQRCFDPSVKIIDVNGAYIAPGFIDTHIHGAGGFGVEDSVFCKNGDPEKTGADSVLSLSKLLAEKGVTAFNPTLYPSEPELMLRAVRSVVSAMGREEGARIMGLHLEGPFLSPERPGIMRTEDIQPVNLEFLDALWEASQGHIVNMTVAPELKGMRELALSCLKKGIILQAGHTNANYENMVEGMQKGILHSTHLFNAMSKLDHRNPNAVGAILIHTEMSCEIIADGFHVHPKLLGLLVRDKPIDKIVQVTDCLKPAGQETGPFFANGDEVELRGGIYHRISDGVIAGSGFSLIKGVKNLSAAGFSLEDAVKTASFNPAQVMRYNRQGSIIPGKLADITVFNDTFEIGLVMIGGKIVREKL